MQELSSRKNTGSICFRGYSGKKLKLMVRMLVYAGALVVVRNHRICDLLRNTGCNWGGSRHILRVFLLSSFNNFFKLGFK